MSHDPHTPQKEHLDRTLGTSPAGFVGLRNFDEGVVRTLKAEVHESDTGKGPRSNYFISSKLLPVTPPPGLPGVPITFSHPEDVWERYRQPVIVIRRDDISPAMSRWHPGMVTWRAPAVGAQPLEVTLGAGTFTETTLKGFDAYEEKQQAVPFDITYTISILARHRGKGPIPPRNDPTGFTGAAGSPRNQVNKILDYVLRIYAPFSQVLVRDSLDDIRRYSSFMEAISHLDEVPEVTERVLGFALTLRVEAELDLGDPVTRKAVSSPLTIRSEVL
jgi:hypothetical protein